MIGEKQKGHVYYRCHTKICPRITIREEEVTEQIRKQIAPLEFSLQEKGYIRKKVASMRHDWTKQYESQLAALELLLKATESRLNRLTDAYLDQAIDRELFDHKKAALLLEKKNQEEQLNALKNNPGSILQALENFLELAGSAYVSHEMALPEEKRDLLKDLTSNFIVDGKNVSMKLKLPFSCIAERPRPLNGVFIVPCSNLFPKTLNERNAHAPRAS